MTISPILTVEPPSGAEPMRGNALSCIVLRLLLPFLFPMPMVVMGQNVTTNGGSGLAATYPTLNAAITALNAATPSGAQTIITLDQDETAPVGGYRITVQGNVNNQIIIRGAGTTPTVTVTAFSPQASGTIHDAIFEIVGGDWITIENFRMRENPANTTTAVGSNNMTEWGVALLYGSITNGAQNNTIRNNEITLNRLCRNSFGIYSNSSHAANSPASLASPVLATGNNSGLAVQGNLISNVNTGIVVVGPSAAEAAYNDLVTIGGPTAELGNTITDYGTNTVESIYTNLGGSTVNGIMVRYTRNYDISNNTIASTAGEFTATSTLRGIYVQAFATAPAGTLVQTIQDNSISLRHGGSLGILMGIRVDDATSTPTSSLSIRGNDFHTMGHTVASPTGAVTFISVGVATATCAITDNTFTDLAVGSTGNLTFMTAGAVAIPANGSRNVDNNRIVGSFTRTSTTGTVTVYAGTGASAATATESNTGNNFSNVELTGTGTVLSAAWNNTGGNALKTIADNVFDNWTLPASNVFFMTLSGGVGSTASNNLVTNMTKTGGTFTGITSTGLTLTDNTVASITGGGAVTGIASTGSVLTGNTVQGLTASGSNAITGISSTNSTVSGNAVSNINGGGVLTGIISTGSVVNGNTVADLTGNGTSAINGISSTNSTVSGNTVGSIAGAGVLTGISSTGSVVNDNTIANLTGSGTNAINGISSATSTVRANTISDLVGTSTGVVIGISSAAAGDDMIEGNTIRSLRATGAAASTVIGVRITAGATKRVSRNRIHDLWALGTDGLAQGIVVSGGTTVHVYNNLIGDLRASTAGSTDAAASQVIGVDLSGTTANAVRYVSFNTIHLDASSTGANSFGTSGLRHATSTTATTSRLVLRNNIIVNRSVPNGANGRTVVYRRTSTTLTNYSQTAGTVSDHNLFYADTPSATNLIYSDGTDHLQTLAAYQAFAGLSPRESNSVSDMPAFLSLDGMDPWFLHLDPNVFQVAESGGIAFTDPALIPMDYDREIRQDPPDIGADEICGPWGEEGPYYLPYPFYLDPGPEILGDPNIPLGICDYDPLPIELLQFDAMVVDKAMVRCTWATASERNNAFFTVERSDDAVRFEEVGRVAGAGDSWSTIHYTLDDDRPLPGESYYRLRQTDLDGTSTLSHMVPVQFAMPGDVRVFPNPSNGSFTMVTDGSGSLEVSMHDGLGRTVMSPFVVVGGTQVPLRIVDPVNGIYFLRVVGDHGVLVTPVSIQR